MKYIVYLAILAGFLTGAESARANGTSAVDSIGFEKVGGKIYVLHKVNQGQTMFAVVRQYGTTIQSLREANPGISDNVQLGQTLRVPYTPKVSKKEPKKEELKKEEPKKEEVKAAVKDAKPLPQPPVTTTAPPTADAKVSVAPSGVHKVEAGQTLYRVAVKYGVLMADIRKWNNLKDDNLTEGQELIVSEKGAEKTKPVVAEPKKVVTNVVKDSVRAKAAVAEKVMKPVEEVAPPKVVSGKRKSESGLAEVIETDESTSKFLALHRTAPIGALIEVLNEYNQEKIIVRVIGRIPETSVNDDIIIKLSSRAFEKVSPNSKRFRAVISYLESN
ncbi:LysM peptidoglycan-binding domain-containing protein [Dyadobacter sp. LHD-138]|uniref:LysM peptidoglycan-binding domain-containing protein n=1 Tax=Dyadobacter sp. LHD-138 TaxID=3071413 RepID=UPI0027E0690B|nr:LysM peptidoglycan-binding domain-containing protein [Dyadobacter sp. LHD-138]MDQ6480812.1 LysM peptidoglycan-binding domain-containing protein [Dyadobacter sp. LHD-138]